MGTGSDSGPGLFTFKVKQPRPRKLNPPYRSMPGLEARPRVSGQSRPSSFCLLGTGSDLDDTLQSMVLGLKQHQNHLEGMGN